MTFNVWSTYAFSLEGVPLVSGSTRWLHICMRKNYVSCLCGSQETSGVWFNKRVVLLALGRTSSRIRLTKTHLIQYASMFAWWWCFMYRKKHSKIVRAKLEFTSIKRLQSLEFWNCYNHPFKATPCYRTVASAQPFLFPHLHEGTSTRTEIHNVCAYVWFCNSVVSFQNSIQIIFGNLLPFKNLRFLSL